MILDINEIITFIFVALIFIAPIPCLWGAIYLRGLSQEQGGKSWLMAMLTRASWVIVVATFIWSIIIARSLVAIILGWEPLPRGVGSTILGVPLLILELVPLYFAYTMRKHRHGASDADAALGAYADGLVVTDKSGLVVFANPAAERMFGYVRDEMIGLDIEALVPGEQTELHQKHRAEYLENPMARPMGIGLEIRAVRKDGADFPVEISLTPVETTLGLRVYATIVDISVRQRVSALSS